VRSREDQNFTNLTDANEETFQYTIGPQEQSIINLFKTYRATHEVCELGLHGKGNGSFVRSHKRNRPCHTIPPRPWYILQRKRAGYENRALPIGDILGHQYQNRHRAAGRPAQVFGVVGMDVTLGDLRAISRTCKCRWEAYCVLLDATGTFLAVREAGRVQKRLTPSSARQ
jgi:hypothetical protein